MFQAECELKGRLDLWVWPFRFSGVLRFLGREFRVFQQGEA